VTNDLFISEICPKVGKICRLGEKLTTTHDETAAASMTNGTTSELFSDAAIGPPDFTRQ